MHGSAKQLVSTEPSAPINYNDNDIDTDIGSNIICFADDTRVFCDVNGTVGSDNLQSDLLYTSGMNRTTIYLKQIFDARLPQCQGSVYFMT